MSLQDIVSNYPSIADISNYWRHYGLTRDPFALGVDSEVYFPLPRWEEHLDLMQYLCNYNNVLIVVAGVSGCGKSTLCQQFIAQLSGDVEVCDIAAEPNLDAPRLMEMMAERFGLPWQPDMPLQEQADAMLNAVQDKAKNAILVIDNANLLSSHVLELLLYFVRSQSEAQMRLRVVLLGEQKLLDQLHALLDKGDEQLIHLLQLDPLDLEETTHYLSQRMAAVGWDEDIPFTKDAIARIYRLSEGIPARINRVARRALLDMINKAQTEKEGFWMEHRNKIFGVLFLVLVLLVVLWYFGRSHGANPMVAFETTMPQKAMVTSSPPAPTGQVLPPPPPPLAAAPTSISVSAPPPPPAPSQSMLQKAEMAVLNNSHQTHKPNAAVPIKNVEKPTKKIASLTLTADEQHLLKMKKTDYTVQLVGLSSESRMRGFIKQYKLQGKAWYFCTTLNGKNFYILVYGQYPNQQAANLAITTLPEVLRKMKPWSRDLVRIQQSIKARS